MKLSKNNFGLVTGAAGFLGVEHCKSILESNLGLVMIDVNKNELEKSYNYLKKNYPNSKILKFLLDITSEKKILKLYNQLNKKKIFVRTLINNACIDPKPKKTSKKKICSENME